MSLVRNRGGFNRFARRRFAYFAQLMYLSINGGFMSVDESTHFVEKTLLLICIKIWGGGGNAHLLAKFRI